jgi:DNA polymerase-3 subunit epsilon
MRDRCAVEDSLELARQRYPGQRNSLDALCKRLGVDNSHRQLHGALLDAQLLAEAYLALTAGQGEIGFDSQAQAAATTAARIVIAADGRSRPRVQVMAEELAAHEARLAQLRIKAGRAIWDLEAAGLEIEVVPA